MTNFLKLACYFIWEWTKTLVQVDLESNDNYKEHGNGVIFTLNKQQQPTVLYVLHYLFWY